MRSVPRRSESAARLCPCTRAPSARQAVRCMSCPKTCARRGGEAGSNSRTPNPANAGRARGGQATPCYCQGARTANAPADSGRRYRFSQGRPLAGFAWFARWGQELPVSLGHDFDRAVGHFDGRLIVNRIRRIRDRGRPSFCLGHGIARQVLRTRCGQIEKSTMPSVRSSSVGGFHWTKSSPMQGVSTMLPALRPTQTARSDGRRSANPDWRIQWHRYKASPPATSRTSAPDQGNPTFFIDAGKRGQLQHAQGPPAQPAHGEAVVLSADEPPWPRARTTMGCPYAAVGMQRALDSAIGLPSRSTSASRMLAFLTPADVRRSFMLPPRVITADE